MRFIRRPIASRRWNCSTRLRRARARQHQVHGLGHALVTQLAREVEGDARAQALPEAGVGPLQVGLGRHGQLGEQLVLVVDGGLVQARAAPR